MMVNIAHHLLAPRQIWLPWAKLHFANELTLEVLKKRCQKKEVLKTCGGQKPILAQSCSPSEAYWTGNRPPKEAFMGGQWWRTGLISDG